MAAAQPGVRVDRDEERRDAGPGAGTGIVGVFAAELVVEDGDRPVAGVLVEVEQFELVAPPHTGDGHVDDGEVGGQPETGRDERRGERTPAGAPDQFRASVGEFGQPRAVLGVQPYGPGDRVPAGVGSGVVVGPVAEPFGGGRVVGVEDAVDVHGHDRPAGSPGRCCRAGRHGVTVAGVRCGGVATRSGS